MKRRRTKVPDNGDKNIYFEQYKAYMENLNSISSEHSHVRAFYVSILSALLLFISFVGSTDALESVSHYGLIAVNVLGIIICLAWYIHTVSFGKLFYSKFTVLKKMEANLPFAIFETEWEILKSTKFKPLIKIESFVSLVVSIPFIILLCSGTSTNVSKNKKDCCCEKEMKYTEQSNEVKQIDDTLLVPARRGIDSTDLGGDSTIVLERSLKSLSTDLDDPTTLINHKGYVSLMHDEFHVPLWVYHILSKEKLDSGVKRERPSGYPQDKQYTSLKATVYNKSGYQHGHLAPAGDFKRSESLYYESHYMTNMAPQHGCLNEIGWCYLESMTRNWAEESKNTVTHVISGSIVNEFRDTLCYDDDFKIYVPGRFFKAVLIEDKKNPENSRAIGFIVSNDHLTKEEAKKAQCSIDKIEKLIGYDLFAECTNLEKSVIAKAESKVGKFEWNKSTDCGGKGCESVYPPNRVHPDKRKILICED